jgi:hypothetical protein
MKLRTREWFSISCKETCIGHDEFQSIQRDVAFRVKHKGLFEKRRAHWIGNDCESLFVVEVAKRRKLRPDTVKQFLAFASSDVLGKVIGKMLTLAEHEGKEVLAGRRWIKWECRET